MNRRRPIHRRAAEGSAERGAVAVETAFSLTIVMFLVMAGIHFVDAMTTKQHVHSATTRAARICMVEETPGQARLCAEQQVEAALRRADLRGRCQSIQTDVVQFPGPVNGTTLMRVTTVCGYVGIEGFNRGAAQLWEESGILNLEAQTTVPLSRN